jgi:hypothetical protein
MTTHRAFPYLVAMLVALTSYLLIDSALAHFFPKEHTNIGTSLVCERAHLNGTGNDICWER